MSETRNTAHGRVDLAPRRWGAFRSWSGLKESRRLRVVGALVFVCGLIGASVYYVVEARPEPLSIDSALPGYDKARNRQMGMLMGHTGVMMMEWQETLDRPGTQAVLIAAVASLFALGFFRAARLLDEDEQAGRGTTVK